jgi:signal transduction histidine kinase
MDYTFQSSAKDIGVTVDFLDQFFPFSMLINRDMEVADAGRSLVKLIPDIKGAKFVRLFRYKRPVISIEYSFDSLAQHGKEVLILEADIHEKSMLLRGQVLAKDDVILFVGSPWFDDVTALDDFGLVIEDFSIHDPAVDLLYVLHAQRTAVAEITRSRNQLKEQSIALETKNEELEQFAYVASHDLQEPLRTISNFSSLLSERYGSQLDELGNKSVAFIEQAAVRLHQLVVGLLDYSRVGKQATKEVIDCNQLLSDIQNDLAATIKENQAIVEVDRLPTVSGYKVELRLLFQNVLDNAIKFRRDDTIPQIQVSASEQANFWLFSVSDNGIGIAPEFQHRIFQIFQRLHHRHEYSGTGIGLAHCKKIVELHGGGIWVESEVGQGAKFFFSIRK